MKDKDIIEDVINIDERHGTVTHDEIHNAFSSESFSLDESEGLDDFLEFGDGSGIDYLDSDIDDEETSEEREYGEHEKTEDLIQTYFTSMGSNSSLRQSTQFTSGPA